MQGANAFSGTGKELLADPEVRKSFWGDEDACFTNFDAVDMCGVSAGRNDLFLHAGMPRGGSCAETSYAAQITAAEGDILTFTTDAETLQGRMIASDDNLHYIFEAPSAAHLLTDYPDGAARYTIHMDGPFTITYHGTCEGAP